MSQVLVISNDFVSKKMAGPAIRCFELSRVLSRNHEVTLACENEPDIKGDGFSIFPFKRDPTALRTLAERSDVIVIPPYTLAMYPFLQSLGKPLVMDLYDPFILEKLEVYRTDSGDDQFEADLAVLRDQLMAGDFFIAGTEDQRSLWIGMLSALGRINPKTYSADKSLQNLVCVLPFGVSNRTPQHTKQVLKGVVKGIGPDDFVLIWAGGIWNWFDPFTLLYAMSEISKREDAIKLFFLGVRHPHPAMPKEQFRVAREAKSLALELGILDKCCFFNHEWVPYADRQNYLLEADAGVSTHFDHVENRFSLRTRALDYIWSGLPMISTDGDYISRLVQTRGAGLTVPQQDAPALVDAILQLFKASDNEIERMKQAQSELADEFQWARIAQPLDEFCKAPKLAADKSDEAPVEPPPTPAKPTLVEKFVYLLKNLFIK
ncbi:glycosyltransferase family 4 protein [bacterium]|nr:glycosyltransferase family 4 protein [bacterium]